MEAGLEEAGEEPSSNSPLCTPPGQPRQDTPQEQEEGEVEVTPHLHHLCPRPPGLTCPTSCRPWPPTAGRGEALGAEEATVRPGEVGDEEDLEDQVAVGARTT